MPITREDAIKAGKILMEYRRQTYWTKVKCQECGSEFEGYPWQKYCSNRCRRAVFQRRRYRRKKQKGQRESPPPLMNTPYNGVIQHEILLQQHP